MRIKCPMNVLTGIIIFSQNVKISSRIIEYAKSFGLDVDHVLFSQPNSAEQALDIAESLLTSEEVDCVVIDSTAALTPQAEIDGEMGDAHMALLARLMSKICRKMTSSLNPLGPIVIWVSQLRSNMSSYGSPECVTPDCLVEIQFEN